MRNSIENAAQDAEYTTYGKHCTGSPGVGPAWMKTEGNGYKWQELAAV